MGPPGNPPPRPPRWGDKYAAKGARAFALLLGLLANLTVIGSLAPSGIVLWQVFDGSFRFHPLIKSYESNTF